MYRAISNENSNKSMGAVAAFEACNFRINSIGSVFFFVGDKW